MSDKVLIKELVEMLQDRLQGLSETLLGEYYQHPDRFSDRQFYLGKESAFQEILRFINSEEQV